MVICRRECANQKLCLGFSNLHELCSQDRPDYRSTSMVPLFNAKRNTINSNKSSDIIVIFTCRFNDLEKNLFPVSIDDICMNESMRHPNCSIQWNSKRCGLAKTQNLCTDTCTELFDCLDIPEEQLAMSRYFAHGWVFAYFDRFVYSPHCNDSL